MACSTIFCASAVASRSLVWPWNSGSRTNTDSMAPAPTMTSSLVMAAADALLGALGDEIEELVGGERIAGEPVVERILDRLLDDALSLRGGEPVLGLALEFRLADEDREHGAGAGHDVVGGHRRGALALADALGVVL